MSALSTAMVVLGVVCILAAIVGGGLKALGYTLPVLNSRVRQVILALFGAVILVVVRAANYKAPETFQVTGVTVAWDNPSAPEYLPSTQGCDFDRSYTASVTTEGGTGSFEERDFTFGQENRPQTAEVGSDDVGHVKKVGNRVTAHLQSGYNERVNAILVIWDGQNNRELMRAESDPLVVFCPGPQDGNIGGNG